MKLNPLQKIGAFIFNLPARPRTEVVQDVKVTEENKELRKHIASLEGQLGKAKKYFKQQKKKEKDSELKKEISEKLSVEIENFESEEIGEFVSFNGFFSKLFGVDIKKRSKWGQKIKFSDKDSETIYPYGDMGFTTKGFFVLKDNQGNVVNRAVLPRKLFKTESFKNNLKRGFLQMNIDKEGDYYPEFDQIEVPSQVYDEDAHIYKETEELQVKAIDIIREKDTENRILRQSLEQFEIAFRDITNDLNLTKSQILILSKTNNIANADFSAMQEKLIEHSRNTYDMAEKIVNLSEKSASKDEKIDSLEKSNKELRGKTEVIESRNNFENAKAVIEDIQESTLSKVNYHPIN